MCDIGVNNRGSTILCRFWLLLNISYNYHRSDSSAFAAVATFSCFFLFFVNFCLYLVIVCTFIALTNTTPILLMIKWKLMKKCMGCPHSLHKTMHNIWILFLTSCYKECNYNAFWFEYSLSFISQITNVLEIILTFSRTRLLFFFSFVLLFFFDVLLLLLQ